MFMFDNRARGGPRYPTVFPRRKIGRWIPKSPKLRSDLVGGKPMACARSDQGRSEQRNFQQIVYDTRPVDPQGAGHGAKGAGPVASKLTIEIPVHSVTSAFGCPAHPRISCMKSYFPKASVTMVCKEFTLLPEKVSASQNCIAKGPAF